MIAFAARRLMERQVEGLTGAAHGERRVERINHRRSLYAAALPAALPAAFPRNAALEAHRRRPVEPDKLDTVTLAARARKLLVFANTVVARGPPFGSSGPSPLDGCHAH